MAHRGPDSEGLWDNGKNYLAGFRRLSIRDLSKEANQPMVSDCGNYVLVFNGEIYNTDELIQNLTGKGVSLKTSSDTEILLYNLIYCDLDKVLNDADGIFAFAFFDVKKEELILARDRAGVKPLYVGFSETGLVYSSQYDHITNCPILKSKRISGENIGTYLQLGYMPAGIAVVEDTFLVPHGHFMRISVNSIGQPEPFFQFPIFREQAKTESSLDTVLEDSVKSQLVSDVPLGTFLSGGVDSPLVTHYASKAKPQLQSYSIGMENVAFDESGNAAFYAEKFNTEHHLRIISEQDLLNTISDNTNAFSEPFSDYSSIPTLILSKLARQKLTVALSGDGGDELFWGYPRNSKIITNFHNISAPKARIFFKILIEKAFGKKRTVTSKELKYADFATYYYNSVFISGASYWVPKILKVKPTKSPVYFEARDYWESSPKDILSATDLVRKIEFDLHLQRILMKVDRSSMFHSLEVRVPVLSKEMLQKSVEYTHFQCFQHGQGKFPLKEMLHRVSGSKKVWEGKKGFGIPLGGWMRNKLKNEMESKVLDMPEELIQFFQKEQLEKMLHQHMQGAKDWSWMIWALYSLVNWYDTHFEKFRDTA